MPVIASRSGSKWAAVCAASLVAAAVLTVAPAEAAKPRCMGKKATKVGTAASETIRGTKRADVIVARGGNDTIIGKRGNDRICAGPGDDFMVGGPGNDVYSGGLDGEGRRARGDTASFAGSARGVAANLKSRTAAGQGADRLLGVEDLKGSPHADTLTGSDARNDIDGGGGRDRISGEGGDDNLFGVTTPPADTSGGTISGGAGDDLIMGTDGSDGLSGGDGDDELYGFDGPDFLSGDDGEDYGDAGNPTSESDGDGCDVSTETTQGCEFFTF